MKGKSSVVESECLIIVKLPTVLIMRTLKFCGHWYSSMVKLGVRLVYKNFCVLIRKLFEIDILIIP